MATPVRLGVNIDHAATLRNARGGALPDPIRAAHAAIAAGAHSITAHLREDRRHIRDADIERLMEELDCPLNLEIAATPEMVAIAARLKPHAVCLVPERRAERTTEGGLDVIGQEASLKPALETLLDAGIRVSLFIEPNREALKTAIRLKAPVVELHTGAWCDALAAQQERKQSTEFLRLTTALDEGVRMGLEMHAGHGLNYATAEILCTHPAVKELNIGHFLIGESLFTGLATAITAMLAAMQRGRGAVDRIP
jgi:pyridoxine 5-phosphate synthase